MKSILNKIQSTPNAILGKPVDTTKIILCQKELAQNNVAPIPTQFLELLHNFNGVSYDGAQVFGIFPIEKTFQDIVKVNLISPFQDKSKRIVLGRDEFDYMTYNTQTSTYQIIDKEDLEVLEEYTDIEQALYYILKI